MEISIITVVIALAIWVLCLISSCWMWYDRGYIKGKLYGYGLKEQHIADVPNQAQANKVYKTSEWVEGGRTCWTTRWG